MGRETLSRSHDLNTTDCNTGLPESFSTSQGINLAWGLKFFVFEISFDFFTMLVKIIYDKSMNKAGL
jgi:hypothetical protein